MCIDPSAYLCNEPDGTVKIAFCTECEEFDTCMAIDGEWLCRSCCTDTPDERLWKEHDAHG